ncbi:MAG: MFS transporter [Candidatus Nitrosoabyssus spongiisocia]|nr:MAG: MFS transporter [Nitrosopumilaceae archaeon AB1(1)]
MKTLFIVNLTGLIIGISYGLQGPIIPIFAKDVLGASYVDIGFVGFANFAPYMFIPILVGILLDRFNNSRLLSIGIILNTLSVYILTLAQSIPDVIISRIIAGVAHAFFWPSSEAIISNSSTPSSRVSNLAKFSGLFITGFMIGPFLGGILFDRFDATYTTLFQVSMFILASTILFGIKPNKKITYMRHRRIYFSFNAIRKLLKFPEIISMLFFCTISFGTILAVYPAYLHDNAFSLVEIEVMFFIFGMSRVATLICANFFKKRTKISLLLIICSITIALAMSSIPGDFWWFISIMLLFGFGFSIFFPLSLDIILNKIGKNESGGAIGAYETIFGIGWTMGPFFAGFLSMGFSESTPYMLYAIFGTIIIAMIIIRRDKLVFKYQ